MNDGILTGLLIVVSLILLATGWKDTLLADVSHRTLLLFFLTWLALAPVTVPFGGWSLGLAFPLLAVWTAAGVYTVSGARRAVLSAGAFLAVFDFIMLELFRFMPGTGVVAATFDMSFSMAAVAALLLRKPVRQITAISLGVLAASVLALAVDPNGVRHGLGGARFQDHWWLAVILARTLTVAAAAAAERARTAGTKWLAAWKGRRS